MATTSKKILGSIFNNPGFFRLRDANRGTGNNPGNAPDIEMNPIGAQAANPQQGQGAHQEPNPRLNTPRKLPRMSKLRSLFTLVLVIGLVISGIMLLVPINGSKKDTRARWSREGLVEKLTPRQVIFASAPERLTWAWFVFFMSVQVVILETVYSYASFAASGANTVARIMRTVQILFLAVAAVVLGIVMRGWLLWFI